MKPNETNESYESEFHDDGSHSDDDDLASADEALELERIEEFRHQSLHEEDPLAACLGAQVSRLMEFAKLYG